MNTKVDARGLACPMPVIKTKKAIESAEGGVISCIVDNEIARENVKKLASSMNLEFKDYEKDGDFYIEIIKGERALADQEEKKVDGTSKEVVFIGSELMGSGNDELGRVLIKGFVYTLTETKPYPKAVILVNSGIKLTTVNEETVVNLKKLESAGVEILSCGTCLDYYSLKDELKVGKISNMYDIVETLKSSSNTIRI